MCRTVLEIIPGEQEDSYIRPFLSVAPLTENLVIQLPGVSGRHYGEVWRLILELSHNFYVAELRVSKPPKLYNKETWYTRTAQQRANHTFPHLHWPSDSSFLNSYAFTQF